MEPFRNKLRRWIFAEKNKKPLSIMESEIKLKYDLSENTLYELGEEYHKIDNTLFFGISYHYLATIFEKLGLIENEEEKLDVYDRSGYGRRINQQCCGMQLKNFLEMLEVKMKALEKKSKKNKDFINPYKNFEDFVRDIIHKLKENKNEHKDWERNLVNQRQEIMILNSGYKLQKIKKICEILSENPEMELDELDEELMKNSYSMSVYEKIFILKSKIGYLNLIIDNYDNKLQDTQSFYADKRMNITKKLEQVILRKNDINKQLNDLETVYRNLFEKSLNYYY